jgi:hypothetical protein
MPFALQPVSGGQPRWARTDDEYWRSVKLENIVHKFNVPLRRQRPDPVSSIGPQSLGQLIGTDDFDGTTSAVEAATVSTHYSSLILTRPSRCLLPPVSLAEYKI